MAISIGSGFALHKRAVLDDRTLFDTVKDMKDYSENFLGDMGYAFVKENGKMYIFNRDNEVSDTTGKWRLFTGGGGSSTLSEDLTSAFNIGGVKEGDQFAEGEELEVILRKILFGSPIPTTKPSYYGTSAIKTTDFSDLTALDAVNNFTIEVTANNEYVIIACPIDAGDVQIFSNGFDYTSSFTNTTIGDYKFFYSEAKVTCDDFSYTITYI